MSDSEVVRPTRDRFDAEERLVAAAAELLGEVGPHAMSVRAVGERAGVNHGLVHHYFGGKEGLLQAAMTRLVEEHAEYAKETSHGEPIPVPFILKEAQRYLRAVVHSVLDGEMKLATTEITAGVSVPRGAMQHAVAVRKLSEPDIETKSMVAIGMALEMGWASLEPFLFAVAEVASGEEEEVRNFVRTFRTKLMSDFLQ